MPVAGSNCYDGQKSLDNSTLHETGSFNPPEAMSFANPKSCKAGTSRET
jgi:hypothetical protein